jgi:hypothetical protein
VVVVSVLEGLDHCALDDELAVGLNFLLVVVEGADFLIKSSLQLLA